MAWTAPTVRATGDLITTAIYNADLIANLAYLHGDDGTTVAIGAPIAPTSVIIGAHTISQTDSGLQTTMSDREVLGIGDAAVLNTSAGVYGLLLSVSGTPNDPANGSIIFCRSSDGATCVKGHNGTVTVLGAA